MNASAGAELQNGVGRRPVAPDRYSVDGPCSCRFAIMKNVNGPHPDLIFLFFLLRPLIKMCRNPNSDARKIGPKVDLGPFPDIFYGAGVLRIFTVF